MKAGWLIDDLLLQLSQSQVARKRSTNDNRAITYMWWYFQTHVIVHRAMLLSTGVCYCTQIYEYVFVHVVVFSDPCYRSKIYFIFHRAILSSMWWYSQTHVIIHRAMLSSTGVCYCPQSYVIIHRSMLLSKGQTRICYHPWGYVIVQRGMFLSTGLCYPSCGGVLRPLLFSIELCYHPCGGIFIPMLSSTGEC